MEISKYRMISGLRSHRPNPIIIERHSEPTQQLRSAEPRSTQRLFEAKKYDKDHTFNYLQFRWFKKRLDLDEEITMTAQQLKRICDEAHEMGKMRQALLDKGE